jgi:hypothetical protein
LKSLRKRSILILLALFLLPLLASLFSYSRQERRKNLDHALIEAIKNQDTPTAIAMLNEGADANAVDKPYTPLTFRSLLSDFWNRFKRHPPPKEETFYEPALGLPYRMAAIDSSGKPIHGVARFVIPPEKADLITALLEHKANPNASDENGLPVFHLAVCRNHIATVKAFLAHHIDPNITDTEGATPLMRATNECALILLKHGADTNVKDNNGQTALIRAIISYVETPRVRLYVDHGAKVSLTDCFGMTALDYARKHDAKDLVPLLEGAFKRELEQKVRQK